MLVDVVVLETVVSHVLVDVRLDVRETVEEVAVDPEVDYIGQITRKRCLPNLRWAAYFLL